MSAGFINTGINGQPRGYELYEVRQARYFLVFLKAIYEFTLIKKTPLMYCSKSGILYQPDAHFETDQGSLPRVMQFFIQKDRFLGFLFHDSGYRFRGLWTSYNGGRSWQFVAMLRAEVDALLREMIECDPFPGSVVARWLVWSGVRIGGWIGWDKGDERRPRPRNKIDSDKPPIAFA